MAGAIIGGLVACGYPASNIFVSEPWEEARSKLESSFKVKTTTDNSAAITFSGERPADLVVLAVKPQVMKGVAEGIAQAVLKTKPVVVSIAAGITLPDFARWLGGDRSIPLVRVMPNTPALVSEGATGLFAGENVSEEQKALAFNVLGAVSKSTYWVEKEELLDVVTGVSGMVIRISGMGLSYHRPIFQALVLPISS